MKPLAVIWDNDCAYGTEYFDTEAEQQAFIADCKRYGTNAMAVQSKDLQQGSISPEGIARANTPRRFRA